MNKEFESTKIKECVPGILTEKEKKEYPKLNKQQEDLKHNELWFRVKQGVI